jgi:hypothetical protein
VRNGHVPGDPAAEPFTVVRGEPAEVVEADLGLGQTGEECGRLRVEVPQQPIADTVVRHGPELLLDLLDSCVEVEVASIEPDRVQVREPADRP